MGPPVDLVIPSPTLPADTDVVVIGGGIAGVSTALFLAEKGIRVALCEKGEIGAEQSSRNWGWCRTQSRDPREIPLSNESLRLWRGMNQRIGGDTGWDQCGILALCATGGEMAAAERWEEEARLYQLDSRLISADEIERLVPGVQGNWKGALYSPTDGRAEPQMAAPAIARGAQAAGALVFTNCAVRGVETAGGKVAAVMTEKGRIRCGSVVLAGGAWSSLMCDTLGIRLPQLKILGNVMRTAPLEGGPEISTKGNGFGLRKRRDGGYNIAYGQSNEVQIVPDSFRYFFDFLPQVVLEWQTMRLRLGHRFAEEIRLSRPWTMDEVSPFERVRILDPKPLVADMNKARRNLEAVFPVFRQAKIEQMWAGLIDVTPDAVPVISPVETTPGLFLITGFSGHGFGVGPAAGRLAAELVTGDAPIVDPTPFAFSRFEKGRKPVLKSDLLAKKAADITQQV
ncbi:MAG TPA: FAD-binding oxidoreductase [Stellaceae bacterium]|nr:FAD-binding oxidoreductase [Stellaceae bacterium]